ncbi:hypothetical protein [Anaeroselena agilis]|uniref:DUF4126 domain-containing protein n=1 Tax=Anaeroselena agilis TaxID=3063788 RepID=A0ABU3P196_9FIRM|nr:hypothetical protein [Selenomonadales bacterium 4137-cl]
MAYVLAVLMAALSFLLNRAALRIAGLQAVISWGPVIEEAAKTAPAFYLGADVLLTHVLFGVIEAGYDWRSGGGDGPAAALLSVAGHSLFGALTVGVIYLTGSLAAALALAVVAHVAWNVALVRLKA